jgi:hypothetical protein
LTIIEKQNANRSCSTFHSQSLTESSDVLVSLCSEKDVATQKLDSSGPKLHFQETSKSKWSSCWSSSPPQKKILSKTTGFLSRMKTLAVQPARKLEAWVPKKIWE